MRAFGRCSVTIRTIDKSVPLYCRVENAVVVMDAGRKATERTMRLAELHVAQQEARIERQRELISSLEADGHVYLARGARQLLVEMTILLGQMHDDWKLAQARMKAWETR